MTKGAVGGYVCQKILKFDWQAPSFLEFIQVLFIFCLFDIFLQLFKTGLVRFNFSECNEWFQHLKQQKVFCGDIQKE